jgi:Fanconi-associated nuclease 1
MPDLCLWKLDKLGEPVEVIFSEVKGPGDTLSDKQRVWLDSLHQAGIKVHVCLIQENANDERSLKRKATDTAD